MSLSDIQALPTSVIVNLTERVSKSRIGQPWREACEIRSEQRHRALLNMIGTFASGKNWKTIPQVDVRFLPPMYMTDEELNEQADRIKQEQEARELFEFVGLA